MVPTSQRVVPGAAVRLGWALSRHQRGRDDPALRRVGTAWFRATRTPAGDALLLLAPDGADVHVDGWGPGAGWALDQVDHLLGSHDSWAPFLAQCDADDSPVAQVVRRSRHLLIGGTQLVAEALVPTVIQQKVTGEEAFASHRLLLQRFGVPAPGPATERGHPAFGLRVPPGPDGWLAIPSWEWLRCGVEERRMRTVITALRRIDALQRIVDEVGDHVEAGDRVEAGVRLRAALEVLPGLGPWTSARLAQLVLGDPDSWSVGDYHIPGRLGAMLSTGPLDPAELEAALDRYRPHRYRVEIAVLAMTKGPARRGPRSAPRRHLGW